MDVFKEQEEYLTTKKKELENRQDISPEKRLWKNHLMKQYCKSLSRLVNDMRDCLDKFCMTHFNKHLTSIIHHRLADTQSRNASIADAAKAISDEVRESFELWNKGETKIPMNKEISEIIEEYDKIEKECKEFYVIMEAMGAIPTYQQLIDNVESMEKELNILNKKVRELMKTCMNMKSYLFIAKKKGLNSVDMARSLETSSIHLAFESSAQNEVTGFENATTTECPECPECPEFLEYPPDISTLDLTEQEQHPSHNTSPLCNQMVMDNGLSPTNTNDRVIFNEHNPVNTTPENTIGSENYEERNKRVLETLIRNSNATQVEDGFEQYDVNEMKRIENALYAKLQSVDRMDYYCLIISIVNTDSFCTNTLL